jgi:hypothetical protein
MTGLLPRISNALTMGRRLWRRPEGELPKPHCISMFQPLVRVLLQLRQLDKRHSTYSLKYLLTPHLLDYPEACLNQYDHRVLMYTLQHARGSLVFNIHAMRPPWAPS